jgi:hypothetical protein
LKAALAVEKINTDKNVDPSMVQLLFAQTVGLTAATKAFDNVDGSLDQVLATARNSGDGIDLANLDGRDKDLLVGPTVKDALAVIETKLGQAFNSIEALIDDQVADYMKRLRELTDAPPAQVGDINFNSSKIPRSRVDMAQLIAIKFAERGYGPTQQIAAIANAIGESALNPSKPNLNGERSFGLFQLNQNRGVGYGHSEAELTDPNRNIEIMLDEIQKPYLKASRASFIATQNLQEAVRIFVYDFERPKDKASDTAKRYAIAQTLIA